MPVYKLTEKRLKKRRRHEADAEALELALREMQDASGGSSGSEDEDEGEDEDISDDESIGTMDSEDDSSDDEDASDEASGIEESEASDGAAGQEDEEVDDSVDDDFDLTVDEVSIRPTYSLHSPPHPSGSSSCVLCPTRIFKNDHMVSEHLASKGHKRAMKRWDAYLAKARAEGKELDEDPRTVVEEIMDSLEVEREEGPEFRRILNGAGRKRDKRKSKSERTEKRAMKMIEDVQSPASKKQKGDTPVKLNRKARRMAERQGIKVD